MLRIGIATACGQNLSSKLQKMIMADEEGTRIGVLIFNDDVNIFAGRFRLQKTYFISNGEVKKVNPMFPNAHPEKELVLKRYTTVKDAFAPIGDNIKFNFVEFDEIDEKLQSTKELDIYGILVKVKESRTTTSSKGAQKQVREITIINKQYRPIVISLWEDLAKNEGLQLQEIAHQNPIIAIAKVTAKKYLGELQLQSTAASIIQIDSTCEEIQHIQKWFQRNNDPAKIRERAMIQRMIDAKEATLKEIIHNRNSLSQDTYYSFNGTVERVEKNHQYDMMHAKNVLHQFTKVARESAAENVMKMTYKRHQDDSALITIFEEAATIYVGCTVEEYLTSIEKEKIIQNVTED
ncbi:UNVERIFIED_CONTAM: hypothetical protein Sangu_3065100 [Sesamum angustifolium]|uniref:Replication protein A OB domain-containing protein n=1 Tax=Sesamum angustifolium TaxID=2727405 RepID=A0AAW2KD52_9LAMI